ncbi:MAG: PDZ domain-containing protein [Holophagales bacterium]|nr:PDZ domain-containing protein [Holophagales bacterium]MYG31397.1 PDZ domain-containing protein [Holophagales bacterium]MYI81330.1 PDZ domain-containing protein [Holophagales bacterium]
MSRRLLTVAAVLMVLGGFRAAASAQRIGVQEIGRSDLEIERSTRLPPQAAAALSEAGDIYSGGDSEGAVPLLREVIDTLEPLAGDAGGGRSLADDDPRLFETLRTAWLYLAAALWTLDDREGADQALDRIIRLDPLFELDAETAGRQLTDRLQGRKEELVGKVSFLVTPLDAEIRVGDLAFENASPPPEPPPGEEDAAEDGGAEEELSVEGDDPTVSEDEPEPFVPPEPTAMLVGSYLAQVSRPGYLQTTAAFAITGGRDLEVEVELERDSAVVRLRTAPTGAAVLVNGIERGLTEGQAEPWFRPEGAAVNHPSEDFSRELWLDDLPAGRYRIDIEKDGFRSFRTSLQLPDLVDYELPPIVLEREEAVIGLVGLTEGASVLGNGRVLRPDWSRSPPQVRLPPGAYDLSVTHGALGYFETSVVAEDRRRVDIDVQLRPALVYLGVLGDDPAGLRAVEFALDAFRGAGTYTVLDRGAEGTGLLADLGVDADTLRARSAAQRELDWTAIQGQFQARLPAALYVAAVLNDDLVADAVDLWWWPAVPGPPSPDVRTLRIENRRLEQGALQRLAAALDPDLGRRTPRFGATLIDSGIGIDSRAGIDSQAGGVPIVATVEPGGPAAAAGLVPGMEVITIAGQPASSTIQLTNAVERLEAGDAIELVTRGDGEVTVRRVEPEWGWTLVDAFDPDLLPAAVAARLHQELERAGDIPRWLLELDLANLQLAGGDPAEAVRQLRTIEAPGRSGLGRDTVQYMLGLALTLLAEEGRDEYRSRARDVFDALASTDRGRLRSDAGPEIAPRARLHAEALADN